MHEFNKNKQQHVICELLKHSKLVLKIIGFWPENKSNKYIFNIVAGMYLLMLILNSIVIFSNVNDMNVPSIIVNIFDITQMTIISSRLFWTTSQRNYIFLLITETEEMSVENNHEALAIRKKWQIHNCKIIKYLSKMYAVGVVLYVVGPILSSEKILPIGVALPLYMYTGTWYYVFYIIEGLVVSLAAVGLLVEDVFSIYLVCHLCGELEIVAAKIRKFGNEDVVGSTINFHSIVIARGKKICRLLSDMLSLKFLGCMFGGCGSGWVILTSTNEVVVSKTTGMFVANILTAFLVCYVGETLLQTECKIQSAIIHCDWYKCNSKNQNAIKLMLMKTQKLFKLGILEGVNMQGFRFFIFNLYSYLSILKSVIQR